MKIELFKCLIPFVLVVLVVSVMWPGVVGPFLLDDFLHFPKMAWLADQELGLRRFIFSEAGGSGRPLAFLSLLIEDSVWPTLPLAYKINNVLIHALNTLLVFWVAIAMFRIALPKISANAQLAAAAFAAIWWGIHPIQLSPVMLTIQRMTLLMGTFVLVGVLVYLKSRVILIKHPKRAWMALLVVVPFCSLLAILFKEPGILLPTLLLVLEFSMRQDKAVGQNWRRCVLLFGMTPILLLLAYYFYMLPKMVSLYASRDFNMFERLLTESRVLWDYARIIVFPSMRELGPYQDGYIISRGLLQPATTLLALVAWCVLIALSIFNKIRSTHFAWLSFAVSWFLAGHLLESTFLPIEVYFEHRNYIPMLGVVFAVSATIFSLPKAYVNTVLSVVSLYILCLLFITYQSAKTWGSEASLALNWSNEHPDSARANFSAMIYHLKEGNLVAAEDIVFKYSDIHPQVAAFYPLKLLFNSCYRENSVDVVQLEDSLRHIEIANFDRSSNASLVLLIDLYTQDKCTFSAQQVRAILEAYLANPKFDAVADAKASLYMQLSTLYRDELNFNEMIQAIDSAYEASPDSMYMVAKSMYLAEAGIYEPALCALRDAKNTQDPNKFSYFYKAQNLIRHERYVRSIASASGVILGVETDCSAFD